MKVNLERAWIYEGRVYGPGEVEVDDELGTVLEERQAAALKADDERQQQREEQVMREAGSPQDARAARKALRSNE